MSASALSQQPEGHPEKWRRSLTASEPGVPWVTFYQPSSGARVELSRITFDNWVAKAAGMLAEEYDVESGSTVLLDLQPHWLLPVWAWASWFLGAEVVVPSAPGAKAPKAADVCITDDPKTGYTAGTMLLSSRHPLGLPAPNTPANMVDALADIRAYPDVRNDPIPSAVGPLITDSTESLAVGAALTEILRATPMSRAALVRSRPGDARSLARALLAPAFHASALVIVDGGSAADIDSIREQEHVDVDLG